MKRVVVPIVPQESLHNTTHLNYYSCFHFTREASHWMAVRCRAHALLCFFQKTCTVLANKKQRASTSTPWSHLHLIGFQLLISKVRVIKLRMVFFSISSLIQRLSFLILGGDSFIQSPNFWDGKSLHCPSPTGCCSDGGHIGTSKTVPVSLSLTGMKAHRHPCAVITGSFLWAVSLRASIRRWVTPGQNSPYLIPLLSSAIMARVLCSTCLSKTEDANPGGLGAFLMSV